MLVLAAVVVAIALLVSAIVVLATAVPPVSSAELVRLIPFSGIFGSAVSFFGASVSVEPPSPVPEGGSPGSLG